jgi:hypothetical protein
MATSAQIIVTAAENLGILGEGETLPSYESADLTQAYAEVYAELQALDLTSWESTATIPNQYARAVAMLVAEARGVKYQIPEERYQRIKLEAFEAMKLIRRLQSPAKMGQTEIENF